ncbi:winged helix-turn-helix transcriptional regulator [Staphylococcus xylosus]|nr:transcriptional regulator [Staphylococcus xylosus]
MKLKELSDSLKELEQGGLVNRKAFTQTLPKVEYGQTEKGKALWPII